LNNFRDYNIEKVDKDESLSEVAEMLSNIMVSGHQGQQKNQQMFQEEDFDVQMMQRSRP